MMAERAAEFILADANQAPVPQEVPH